MTVTSVILVILVVLTTVVCPANGKWCLLVLAGFSNLVYNLNLACELHTLRFYCRIRDTWLLTVHHFSIVFYQHLKCQT